MIMSAPVRSLPLSPSSIGALVQPPMEMVSSYSVQFKDYGFAKRKSCKPKPQKPELFPFSGLSVARADYNGDFGDRTLPPRLSSTTVHHLPCCRQPPQHLAAAPSEADAALRPMFADRRQSCKPSTTRDEDTRMETATTNQMVSRFRSARAEGRCAARRPATPGVHSVRVAPTGRRTKFGASRSGSRASQSRTSSSRSSLAAARKRATRTRCTRITGTPRDGKSVPRQQSSRAHSLLTLLVRCSCAGRPSRSCRQRRSGIGSALRRRRPAAQPSWPGRSGRTRRRASRRATTTCWARTTASR